MGPPPAWRAQPKMASSTWDGAMPARDIASFAAADPSCAAICPDFTLPNVLPALAIGTTVGAVCGLALCWVFDRYRLIQIPMDVYQVSYVPFVVEPFDFAVVVVSAIAICFLATIYPSRQASRLDPVQALRLE